MPSAEYQLWMEIQDIVGPANFWTQRIRRYLWIHHLSHWDCILTATFIWVNGLNPKVYWCQLNLSSPDDQLPTAISNNRSLISTRVVALVVARAQQKIRMA